MKLNAVINDPVVFSFFHRLEPMFISLLNFGFHVEFRMKIYPLQNLKHKQGMKGRVQVQVRKKDSYNLVRFGLERERKQRINLE